MKLGWYFDSLNYFYIYIVEVFSDLNDYKFILRTKDNFYDAKVSNNYFEKRQSICGGSNVRRL